MSRPTALRPDANGLLAAIAAETRPSIRASAVVVVAHPDDEILGCGGLLPRLADVRVLHVTDGAPREGGDAARHGFASPAAYAAARHGEAVDALNLAGLPASRLAGLGVPDQGAAADIAGIARRLVPMLAGADLVLTHAYEGGHPDHDAVCCAVHGAVGRLGPAGPVLVEFPLYRLGPDGAWLRQGFASPGEGVVLRLSPPERALKARMIACHRTQRDTLDGFGAADEPYRAAPPSDFAILPNGGDLLYERHRWGLTGRDWLARVAAARAAFADGP